MDRAILRRLIAPPGGQVLSRWAGLVTVVNPELDDAGGTRPPTRRPARHVPDGALADAAALGLHAGVPWGNERPDRLGASP